MAVEWGSENYNSAIERLSALAERNMEAIVVGLVVFFLGLAIAGSAKGASRVLSQYYIRKSSAIRNHWATFTRLHVYLYIKYTGFRNWVDDSEAHYFRLTLLYLGVYICILMLLGFSESTLGDIICYLLGLILVYPFARVASGYLVLARLRHGLIRLVNKRIHAGKRLPPY